ncbi:HD domain-containing protein [Defluviitalea phaphyphila]|uniref:HD domain-containing protein n=1 Tax=Defluviitalea phaphyphila TaxID=1473580 RepID=UPI0007312702|nr:HD domain-containing protein [Defluviitalea phaphyphila]
MKIPTKRIALEYLEDAYKNNPGNWKQHSLMVAECAKSIAELCGLDSEVAYIMGILHDIGRREGVTEMRHIYDGYKFLQSKGYTDVARICLTHSFPVKILKSYSGKIDCTDAEIKFIDNYLESICYNEYDKLIQLCDAIGAYDGVCCIEKRLIDVAIRNGVNEYSIEKWKSFLKLKNYFDKKCYTNIYSLFKIKL